MYAGKMKKKNPFHPAGRAARAGIYGFNRFSFILGYEISAR
jgi:hypothetical protein